MRSGLLLAACLLPFAVPLSWAGPSAPEALSGGGSAEWGGAASAAGAVAAGARKAAEAPPDKSGFKPGSAAVELKNGEGEVWARVDKGTANGLPASRVRTSFDHKTLVAARGDRVSTWDEARALCRAMSPAGNWDLPTETDHMTLLMTQAVNINIATEKAGIYPMWLRNEDESKNKSHLAGKSVLLAMADGKGMDLQPIDIGQDSMSELSGAKKDVEEMLDKKLYRTPAEEKRVAAELAKHRAGGVILNPNLPHPELPDDVNAILAKPSKTRLMEHLATLNRYVDAFGGGYPVYCVSR